MIRDTVNRSQSPVVAVAAAAALLVLLLPLAACAPGSPEEKVAATRAEYKIELNSWRAKKPAEPAAAEVPEEGAVAEASEAAAAAVTEGGEEGGEGSEEEVATGPMPTDILFDLVVYFKGRKSLAGITVDITHAAASQEEKAVIHHYIETAGIVSGETRQVDFVLEGLEFEEGDVFAVEVAPGVPADLSNYREFSETGS